MLDKKLYLINLTDNVKNRIAIKNIKPITARIININILYSDVTGNFLIY